MSFVKFEQGGGRSIGSSVSVSKAGQLTITVNFREHFQGIKYCELYYDKERQLVGIEPVEVASLTTRRVRPWSGSNHGSFVSMTGFLRYNDLPCGKERAIYPAMWDEEKKMLIVNVSTDPDTKEAA